MVALWYQSIPPLGPSNTVSTISPSQLSTLTLRAEKLHKKETDAFLSSSENASSSEANFLSKIVQSGTLSDRLSALTLLVQSSPLHNAKALETLKAMAERGKGKGGRDESLKALRCIVDWWVGGGAPDRKLKYFRDQPLLHPSVTDHHLFCWYFEDWLKKYFFSVLQILEVLSLDPLPYVRTQAMTFIFTLLRDKPEQEQNLLRLLVNKLGDSEKSLCSRASYHLLRLLQSHPSMKNVVVREMVSLVLRPSAPIPITSITGNGKHIRFSDNELSTKDSGSLEKKAGNAHARYYATITFNQIVLTPDNRDVALKLIDLYFELFKELLGESITSEGKERAEIFDEEQVRLDKKGRVKNRTKVKDKGKGKGKATEVKGAAGFLEIEDELTKLISAILTGINRALPFAKLDAQDTNVNKHIDTLFRITHTSTFNISLQALVLIQQLHTSLTSSAAGSSSSAFKSVTDRFYRTLYASLHDPRLASSSKQAMYLNLLYKSIKADAGNLDGERMKAIIHRFVQVIVNGGCGGTEFVAGGLFLLGELFSGVPGLRTMIDRSPKSASEPYDPRKRDPQYAHASSSPLWELTTLLHHYHPTISLHARQLLSSQPLTASPDLSQNTLSHFLDRFVYKNPKKAKQTENRPAKAKGGSAMQPAASGPDASVGVKIMKGEIEDDMRVNESRFLKMKPENVAVDQMFFHKYFLRKNEKEQAKGSQESKKRLESEEKDTVGLEGSENGKATDDEEDEDSDAGEADIWKAMQATMQNTKEGADDPSEESDDLLSNLGMDSDDSGSEDDGASQHGDSDDEDALSLVERSDNEDLISLDEVPDGLIEYDGSDAAEESEGWDGIDTTSNKRKRSETSGGKRKKLRSLPTFASYEDYAKMIEEGPEDNI